ncbi:MAG TPA: SDR family NAD(P)-dependent oxidoreductase [Flavobacteriaceae bacterium]
MKGHTSHKNILIFGSGPLGLMTYDVFKNDPSKSFEVIGFLDIDAIEEHKTVEGLKVYDLSEVTSDFVEEKSIEQIVIAVQNVETAVLLDRCIQLSNLNLDLKIIPPIGEFVALEQIKDLKVDDLLSIKPSFDINPTLIDTYENQVLMITGAAGSIGSELTKMLFQYGHKALILIDTAESPLYNLQQELIQKGISNFKVVVADIRDYNRMDHVFNLHKPKVVFHAAAYKHVPLMEEHPYEAVQVNVVGTKNIASLSVKHGVDKFIFISSDKAVNPTNVMGATKRIAELYINCLKGKGQTKLITTRFGNVLNSSGSVVPLFKKQMDAGGPITVTHRAIERYFMTISEACHLILEAGSMGNGGEIFVFDMGKPIKIYDLAKLMIKLSGHRFPEDIDIKISGLRPGEKFNEELLTKDEHAKSTYHQKIRIAQSKPLPTEAIELKILELCEKASKLQNLELVASIKAIVPEYVSNNSIFEILDSTKKKL